MWTRTIEIAPFRWTCKAIAVAVSTFGTTHISVALEAPIVGRSDEALAFELAPAGICKAFTIETRTFMTTGISFALIPPAFRTPPRALTFDAVALARIGEAIESFAIESSARWWTIETITVKAATFRTARKFAAIGPATIAAAAVHRAGRSSTFESRAAWTSRTTGPTHALTHGLGKFHELVFAQLAVVVFVELGE